MINLVTSVVIYNPNMEDLAVLFSSYNQSIEYAGQHHDIIDKMILVDNNPEGTYKKSVVDLLNENKIHFEYVQSAINGGYGHGHNQAINNSTSDYHLICNPDIEFFQDTISVAINNLQHRKELVLVTPAVYGQDRARHYVCKRNPQLLHLFLRRFCPESIKKTIFKRYLERYEYRDMSYDENIENVPFCTGCFMFFRSSVLRKLKGFDDKFFMYLEDADISRRALKYGKTLYCSDLKVIHRWERGSYKSKKLRNTAISSAFYYSRKWLLKT